MLKQKDMFVLSAIVDKMGLDDDIQRIIEERKKKGKGEKINEEEFGYALLFSIGKKLHRAQPEVTQLISNYTGKSRKDVEEMPMSEVFDLIKTILQEQGVMDFLSQQGKG